MITVSKEPDEHSCASCLDRKSTTHKVAIGDGKHDTVLHFCKTCLYGLHNETAELLRGKLK